MLRITLLIFLVSFLLNLIWEHLHSVLYFSYQGGAITSMILFRAALFDATVITLFSYLFSLWRLNLYKSCRCLTSTIMLVGLLLLFAIILEKWALATGRWAYSDAMPIIPLLKIGLTPVIQLAFLGYISLKISGLFTAK